MPRHTGKFDPRKRAIQKQVARDRDERSLASGKITAAELNRRNGFFSALDYSKVVFLGSADRKRPQR